jgi:hypothetical protein
MNVCQRWIFSDPRRRTCVRDHKDNRWDNDLEAFSIYNVHSPHLSESSEEAKNELVATHNYRVPHYRLKAQTRLSQEARRICDVRVDGYYTAPLLINEGIHCLNPANDYMLEKI